MVVTFHRSGKSFFYSLLRPLATRLAARRFAVRCAVSEAARATAQAAVGGDYVVLFNGVEIDRYAEAVPWPTEGPTVLFLGRHEGRKGLPVLLDAFARLLADRQTGTATGPTLWVAGDGPDTDGLRRLFPESPHVHWLGVLSEEDKLRRLAGAHVLCAPSLGGESFGMVLLEAMAAGTPVVASDIPGYRDAAGGKARLVPPGDATALADALGEVLDPAPGPRADERERCRAEAADRAREWSMDRLAQRYEGLYHGVTHRVVP
jgi:phosphatidylinositol alpha-mannosyltransferase